MGVGDRCGAVAVTFGVCVFTCVSVCICRVPAQAEDFQVLQICSHHMHTPMCLRRMLEVRTASAVNGYLGL